MLAGIHPLPHLCWHIAIYLGAQQDMHVANKNNDPLVLKKKKKNCPKALLLVIQCIFLTTLLYACVLVCKHDTKKPSCIQDRQAGRLSDN